MGISQSEFERIVHEVANERSWDVEINGTEVYLTYHTNRNTYRRRYDYNDGGEITGYCKTDAAPYPGDIQPGMFANMVGNRIINFLKNG